MVKAIVRVVGLEDGDALPKGRILHTETREIEYHGADSVSILIVWYVPEEGA